MQNRQICVSSSSLRNLMKNEKKPQVISKIPGRKSKTFILMALLLFLSPGFLELFSIKVMSHEVFYRQQEFQADSKKESILLATGVPGRLQKENPFTFECSHLSRGSKDII